jgi:hypothetical protein
MCDCADTADQKLADMNTRIDWALLISTKTGKVDHRLHIATKKLDPKKRQGAAVLVCTYCPFCGEKFHEGAPVCASETQTP